MNVLGAIVTTTDLDAEHAVYSPLFDYYDHWSERDQRLEPHQESLSRAAEAFAHDLVAVGAYAEQLLSWVHPSRIREPLSVISASAMAEALISSLRSSCDTLAIPMSLVVSRQQGATPSNSLRALLRWCEKNPNRVSAEASSILSTDFSWFWALRGIRDHIVHNGAHPNIHCDGKQFNLWVYSGTEWVTREPLFPLLAINLSNVLSLAQAIGTSLHDVVPLPSDRLRSRSLHGVSIPFLHELIAVQESYARPSP